MAADQWDEPAPQGFSSWGEYYKSDAFKDSPTYRPPVDTTKPDRSFGAAMGRIGQEAAWGGALGAGVGAAAGSVLPGPGTVAGGVAGGLTGALSGAGGQAVKEFFPDAPGWAAPAVSTGLGLVGGGVGSVASAARGALPHLGHLARHPASIGTSLFGAGVLYGGGLDAIGGAATHLLEKAAGNTLAGAILGTAGTIGLAVRGAHRMLSGDPKGWVSPLIGAGVGGVQAASPYLDQMGGALMAPQQGGTQAAPNMLGVPGVGYTAPQR